MKLSGIELIPQVT